MSTILKYSFAHKFFFYLKVYKFFNESLKLKLLIKINSLNMRSNSPLPAKPRLLTKSAQRNSIRSISLYKTNENSNLLNNDFIWRTPLKENYINSPEKEIKSYLVSNLFNFRNDEYFHIKEQRDKNDASKEIDGELTIGDNFCKPFELEKSFENNILKEKQDEKNRNNNFSYLDLKQQKSNLSSNYLISRPEEKKPKFERLRFKKEEKVNTYSYLEEEKIWNKSSARERKIEFEKIQDNQIKKKTNFESEDEAVSKNSNSNLKNEIENQKLPERDLAFVLTKESPHLNMKEKDGIKITSALKSDMHFSTDHMLKEIPCDKEIDFHKKKGKVMIYKMVKDCLYRTKEVIDIISSDQKSLSKKIISDKMRNQTFDPNAIISCFKINEESKCLLKYTDDKRDSLVLNKNEKKMYLHTEEKKEKINHSNEYLIGKEERIDYAEEQKKQKSITNHEVNKISQNYNEIETKKPTTNANILCNLDNSPTKPKKTLQNMLSTDPEHVDFSNFTPVKACNIKNKENAFSDFRVANNLNDSNVKIQKVKIIEDPPLAQIPKSSARANSSNSKMKEKIDAMFTEAITRSHATMSKHGKICEQINPERSRGKQIYPDQTIYEGDLIHSVRTGFGILKTFSSEIIYSGDWLQDKLNGKGKLYNLKNFKKSEDFYLYIIRLDFKYEIENLILQADQWERFEGEFKEGSVYGLGTLFFKDGRSLKGEWKEGKFVRRMR